MDEQHIEVGGDFNRIFDHQDYLAMISIPDEATCILRAHLILEEVLNLWASKLTRTDDLYDGTFVSFKIKLVVAKNLGMDQTLCSVLDKINDIRNRFSHRKGYKFEDSMVNALKERVNALVEGAKVQPCETFHVFAGGKDVDGNSVERTYSWKDSDNRMKFVLVFVILMLKLAYWIQEEFNRRRIEFTILSKKGR